MEKTKKWRKILAMMLAVVMMLQNAQSVMVFADVTNEQIEQRLAGGRTQTEQQQPNQSQVEARASGEEYKTQPQKSRDKRRNNRSEDFQCRCICKDHTERIPGRSQRSDL